MTARRARLNSIAPAASAEEGAAIVAALETFMRATATSPSPAPDGVDPWQRAALLEGVEHEPENHIQHPWINT